MSFICFRLLTILLSVACCSRLWAATGTVLLRYDSALGTLPHQQGWTYESLCLNTACPGQQNGQECRFQGVPGNDCTLGHGCGPNAAPLVVEHYNAPSSVSPESGDCTTTEWIAFDDGQDYVNEPFPVALPRRNLTFGPGPDETEWGPHRHPAYGAPRFIRAPVGHNAIRLVTGGGVPGIRTLPALVGNDRNTGRLDIVGVYTVPVGGTAVTLVASLAAGNRDGSCELIQMRGFGRAFALGVDGVDGSANQGQVLRGTTSCTQPLFDGRRIQVALARENAEPTLGEFFTVRVVLRSNASVQAWLNDDPVSVWTGAAGGSFATGMVRISPDQQAGTMWVDYVKVLEGELPPTCSDPVFDINGDGRVNGPDLGNGVDGFLDCATGAAPPPDVFNALSDRCKCHDANHDQAVDMRDFAIFQRCLSAGSAPMNPACDD